LYSLAHICRQFAYLGALTKLKRSAQKVRQPNSSKSGQGMRVEAASHKRSLSDTKDAGISRISAASVLR
jgi:hypothetical protein